jgi:hypothetical protein
MLVNLQIFLHPKPPNQIAGRPLLKLHRLALIWVRKGMAIFFAAACPFPERYDIDFGAQSIQNAHPYPILQ